MKIETALKYAQELHNRVRSVNGILATPVCGHAAIKVKRMWIFGSAIKGNKNPNDLDVLIEFKPVNPRRSWRNATLDKRSYRSYGIQVAPQSSSYFYKWLTKGMLKVSRHNFDIDGNIALPRVMIYPRFDLHTVKL